MGIGGRVSGDQALVLQLLRPVRRVPAEAQALSSAFSTHELKARRGRGWVPLKAWVPFSRVLTPKAPQGKKTGGMVILKTIPQKAEGGIGLEK